MNRRRTAKNFLSGKDFKKPGVGSAHQKKQPMSETQITTQEANRLEQLESVISKSIGTFIEVGEALLEIREGKLYRQSFGTFEAYCREKWGISRVRGHQMIQAAEGVKGLPENVKIFTSTESQARELAKVEPERREEVIAKATESTGGKLTAAAIKAAAAPSPTPDPEEEETEVEVIPPPKPDRLPPYTPDLAMEIADQAIARLGSITKNDKSRIPALKKVIDYCNKQLA